MTAIVLFIGMWLMYWTPAIVAAVRQHRQAVAIVVLNLLLGWTGLGWAFALVWALMEDDRS